MSVNLGRSEEATPRSDQPSDYVGELPFALKAGWGVGAFGSSSMLWLVNVFLMFFLVNHLGLNPALAGLVVAITRVWDFLDDPLIGFLTDHTRTRWGARRPWMFVGAIASGLTAAFIFNVPAFDSKTVTAVYELVMLILYFTAFTLFYVPYMAMPADMTDDYSERTSIMSYRVGYSYAAGMVIAAGMPALIAWYGGDREAYERTAIISGALITATMLMTVFFTGGARHRVAAKEKQYTAKEYALLLVRNRPFLTLATMKFLGFLSVAVNGGASLFFMLYVMERAEMGQAFLAFLSSLGGLICLPLWTWLSRGKDKRRFLAASLLGNTLLMMTWTLAGPGESDFVFGLRSFLMGAVGVGALLITFSMLPDTIEYDRITTGLDRAGLYTGLLGFVEKSASAIGPLIIGVFFAAMGVVESATGAAEQPDSAILAIVAAKAWIPASLNVLQIALLLVYRLNEETLEQLRADYAHGHTA